AVLRPRLVAPLRLHCISRLVSLLARIAVLRPGLVTPLGHWLRAALLHLLILPLVLRLEAHRLGRLDVSIGLHGMAHHHHGGAVVIYLGEVLPVGAGLLSKLKLGAHGRIVLLAHGLDLRRPGPAVDAAVSAVVAHAGNSHIGDAVVVHVVNHSGVHVVHTAVIGEAISMPVAALVAESDISKAVVDAAIVANVPAPVTAVESVAVIGIAPPSGGPQSALVRRYNPGARHPVVPLARVKAPVPGGP